MAHQPTTEEERNQWPWWKLKKWALQLLVRRKGVTEMLNTPNIDVRPALALDVPQRLRERGGASSGGGGGARAGVGVECSV